MLERSIKCDSRDFSLKFVFHMRWVYVIAIELDNMSR